MHEISDEVREFAERYTAGWCSQNPANVAAFFSETGSLAINGGPASVGRQAISEAARSFMVAYPDLRVKMDRLVAAGDRVEYHWTLMGTNTGPDGTGRPVRISGFESWRLGADGLIEESVGTFDAEDYQSQVSGSG